MVFFSVFGQENGRAKIYKSPLSKRISVIAVSLDGETVVASDSEGYVFFWGLDGSIRKILRAHMQMVTDISFSSDGEYFATTSFDKQIIVWNFTTGEKVASLNLESRAFALSFNVAGDALFYANRNGLYKASLKNFNNPETFFEAPITCADADGNFMVACGENSLNLFRLTDGKLLGKTVTCDSLRQVEIKGNFIFTTCENGNIQLFEVSGAKLTETASSKYRAGKSAEMIITDDKKVLIANEINTALWNPASGKFFIAAGMPERITALGYGKNGDYFAGSNDGKVILCKAMEGDEMPSKNQVPVKQEVFIVKEQTGPGINVELTTGGIPKAINGRPVQAQQPVEVNSPSLEIYVWDDEHEDGDTISLFLNGEWLLQDYRITAEKKKLTVSLIPERINYLVLYALNLGKFPPNTAVVSFNDGQSEKRLTLESDLKRCAAVSFIMKK